MKTRTHTTKKELEAVAAFLRPIIEATRENYGSRIKLTELLSQEVGAKISRHTVHRWLTEDPTKRQEPKLGLALVMVAVFKKHRREIIKPWNDEERRTARTVQKAPLPKDRIRRRRA